jgi:hypothetical protein
MFVHWTGGWWKLEYTVCKKKSIAFQIQINDNYKWFDCSRLLWVNDTLRKHVLLTKEINYSFILMVLVLYRVFHWVVRTCPISKKYFVLRVANLFEAIIACQMNSIEFIVMLDLNLKGYTFYTHCRQLNEIFDLCLAILNKPPLE